MPKPQATPISSFQMVQATASDGSSAYLAINWSVSGFDVSSINISPDQSLEKTTISMTVSGQKTVSSFCNITIPKNAVRYGAAPTIYVNKQEAENQGFAKDALNFYVWFSSYLSRFELLIVFSGPSVLHLCVSVVIVAVVTILVAIIVMPKIRNTKLH
jgi:hypothetical protein